MSKIHRRYYCVPMSNHFLLDIIVAEHDITLMSTEPEFLTIIEKQEKIELIKAGCTSSRKEQLKGDGYPYLFFRGFSFPKKMEEADFNDTLWKITGVCDRLVTRFGFGYLKLHMMLDVLDRSGFSIIRGASGGISITPLEALYYDLGLEPRTMHLLNDSSTLLSPLGIKPHHLEAAIDNASLILSTDRDSVSGADSEIALEFDTAIASIYLAEKELEEIKEHWNDNQAWFITKERR